MPGPNVDIGRELVVFVDPQAADSLGTAATDYPVAADAVRVITAALNGKAPFEFFEDKRGTSTKTGVVNQKKTAEGSMELYAYTSGTAGTAPDWADLLTSGGWQAITGTGTTVSGSGSTTTVVDVADASGFSVNGCVVISGEIRRITAVDTASTPDNITVTPPLTTAPAASTTVDDGITYYPKDARADSQDAITVWAFNNRSADRLIGWVPGTIKLTLGGDTAAKLTVDGRARRHDRLVSTLLNGSITDVATSITVDSGINAPSDVSTYWQIESEVVIVTAVSGNTWTVTRGALSTSNVAHSDNVEIYPYQPAGTYAGSPVPATGGDIIVASTTLQMQGAELDCDMGVVVREDEHGDAYKLAGYILGMRAIKPSASGWSYYDQSMVRAMAAANRTAADFFAQQGDTAGSIIAFEAPTVRFDVPDLDRGADEVTVTLAGEAEGTVSGEDEIYIMVG